MGYSRWDDEEYGGPKYVPVAERKKKAAKHIKAAQKKGQIFNPVAIEGRVITKTFWGKAWCENLEAYSDYDSRLPRGRTYVRNGSVIDLQVKPGEVKAQVMGSELYLIAIKIEPMLEAKWKALVKACVGKIDSLVELLRGEFSKGVMEIMTRKEGGLFPKPQEISMKCSCPDHAGMCKHIAAALYGVGAILDSKPEWLFVLRDVDHIDLIASVRSGETFVPIQSDEHELQIGDLSALFDIEMDVGRSAKSQVLLSEKPTSKSKKPLKAIGSGKKSKNAKSKLKTKGTVEANIKENKKDQKVVSMRTHKK